MTTQHFLSMNTHDIKLSRQDSGRELFVSRGMFEETGDEVATDGEEIETDGAVEETGKDLEDLQPESFPSKTEAMESCKTYFAEHFHPMIQVN